MTNTARLVAAVDILLIAPPPAQGDVNTNSVRFIYRRALFPLLEVDLSLRWRTRKRG